MAAKTPPDLRLASGKKSCGNCKQYDAQNATCKGYSDYPVEPYLTCDTWMADPEHSIKSDE